jgi:hypothetical protein
MSSYIGPELRRLVRTRAAGLCEYCLVHESDFYFQAEVDHIISEKHGGLTTEANLAYACATCNRSKGSDLGSLSGEGSLIRFFNPRVNNWADHFQLMGVEIIGKTGAAIVTIQIRKLNGPDRLHERRFLQSKGRFPTPDALARAGLVLPKNSP